MDTVGSAADNCTAADADTHVPKEPVESDRTAEEWKQRGNECFKRREFEEAVSAYSQAIEQKPEECAYWLNRSIAYRQLQNWAAAEKDAEKTTELDPKNVKGHYGRALCLQQLRRYAEGLDVCDAGLSLQADNKAIQQLRNELTRQLAQVKEAKLKALLAGGMYGDKPEPVPRNSSSSSSSSDSSNDGSLAEQYQQKKEPREMTEEDKPHQQLCESALAGDVEECRRLLNSGDIENLEWKTHEDGNTALHIASEAGHPEVVQLLLDAGAAIDATNDYGLNAFALAEKGSEVYKLLDKQLRRNRRKKTLAGRRDALKRNHP